MKDEFTSIKTIFDNAPMGMALSTVSGRLVSMNNRFIKMLGYTSLDDVKKHIKNITNDLYTAPEVRIEILEMLEKDDANAPFFVQFKRKDSSVIDVRLFIQKYTHQGNNIDYMISTIEDLSYQKGLEKNIDKIKKQYHQLFNSSTEAVFIHQDEYIIDFNKKARKLFGLTDPLRKYIIADISPKYQPNGKLSLNESLLHIQDAINGIAQRFEWEFVDAKGQRLIAEVALNKIENGYHGNLLALIRDITKEKIAQETLEDHEAMLSTIIDCLPFELIVTDLDSNVIKQNKYTRNIWGDNLGKNVLSSTLSEKGKKTWKDDLEQIKKNHIRDYEIEVQHKGKSIYQHRIKVPYIYNNKINGIINLVIDITDRKKSEQMLIESERRATTQRIALAELVLSQIFSARDINTSLQRIAELISSTLSVARGSIWTLSNNGSQLQCLTLFNAQTNTFSSGDSLFTEDFPDYFNAIKKENRVYAEDTYNDPRTKQLIDSHIKVHGITSLLDSGIFLAGKLIGVVSGEHIGPKRKWMPDEESFISTIAAIVAQLFEEEKRKKAEKELINYKNNLEILVQERTFEIKQLNKELQVSVDKLKTTNEELFTKSEIIKNKNSELKTILQHLQTTQAQLVQSEKMASLGILTAGVAHEINNPLNYIMGSFIGLTHYFEKYESQDKQKTDMLLNSINVGIERISKIVKGLNLFSRNTETLDEDCDIHAIINNCLLMLENKTKQKVNIIKEFSNKNLIVKGNISNLLQVFLNLIYNALQAIPNTGIIKINTAIFDNKIIIKVIDNGIGIEKQNISKITDPFFTTKSPGEGTGLGLSISNTFINEHKGNMQFKSEVNKGTTVIVTLPLKREQYQK